MNILLVPPNDLITNALPNRLFHLAKYWTTRHRLYLLRYPNYPTSTNIERQLERIDIVYKANPAKNPGTYYIKNATRIKDALKKTIEREPIDVIIHANILPSYYAVKLAKKYKIKSIFDYLDHYPESAAVYYKNHIAKKIVYTAVSLATRYNLKNSDTTVTVSYTLKQILEKYTKKPIHLIPNGVDTSIFKPHPKEVAKKSLALEQHQPVLLYYGSITEWIDYDILLKTTAKLKPKHPNILLLLVGKIYKENEKAEIQQKIKELNIEKNILIHAPQPQEKIPLYISASDIVIAPYKNLNKNYGTPVKIFESLSCQTPTFVPDIPEFRIWFGNYLEYYRSLDDLITKIDYVLNQYDNIIYKLKQAREYIKENFDWEKLADKYENIIKLL